MSFRLALLASLLFLVVATGCDSGSDDNAIGSFEAAISGSTTASLRGQAAFATKTQDGSTYTAIGLIDDTDPQDLVVLVLPGLPRSGTFDVADDEAGGLLTLTSTSGDEGTLYIVQSGTLTVTRANDRRVEGRFEVEAVSLIDETDEVSIEGTFEANADLPRDGRPALGDRGAGAVHLPGVAPGEGAGDGQGACAVEQTIRQAEGPDRDIRVECDGDERVDGDVVAGAGHDAAAPAAGAGPHAVAVDPGTVEGRDGPCGEERDGYEPKAERAMA